jgi:Pyridoxamine 5'-phosphate oxidase
MTTWQDVERAAPQFATRVRALFDAHRHKTIATVRADGAPRISGIEAVFEDGELVFGSMANARKGADLRRDPRFALHSATVDPVEGAEAQWPGEAKISGRAIAAGSDAAGSDAAGPDGEGLAGGGSDAAGREGGGPDGGGREGGGSGGGGPDGDRFRADIAEVVHTHLNDAATLLVVEWWTPTHGLRRVERE